MNDHLVAVKKLLKKENLDAVLISSVPNIIHLTNFSYFTDIEREAYILITQKTQYIFTDARYSHAVKSKLTNFVFLEISIDQPFTKHLQNIIVKEKIKEI